MKNFSARETEWMLELDGIPLAGFWRRGFAFCIDWVIVFVIFSIFASALATAYVALSHKQAVVLSTVPHTEAELDKMGPQFQKYGENVEKSPLGHVAKVMQEIVIPVLYFGLLLWKGKGRTPGKRLMKIRVVSIVHRHLSLWHSVERALGYGAAALEAGFGFVQFFIHPYRRCVQDRIAETIVVTEAGYLAMQKKQEHPLVPDGE